MKWTPDLTQRMLRLHRTGFSYPAIAAQMGITEGQVEGKCHRLGVSRESPGRPNPALAKQRYAVRKNREARDDKRRDLRLSSLSKRVCLACKVAFWSEWFGNRVCARCRGQESWGTSMADEPLTLPSSFSAEPVKPGEIS